MFAAQYCPSAPCVISDTSPAHLPSLRCAVLFRTPHSADFHSFTKNRVNARRRASRVRVAQPRGLRPRLGRRKVVTFQRPLQPHQPDFSGMQLRRIAMIWHVIACPFGRVCMEQIGGLLAASCIQGAASKPPRTRSAPCLRPVLSPPQYLLASVRYSAICRATHGLGQRAEVHHPAPIAAVPL